MVSKQQADGKVVSQMIQNSHVPTLPTFSNLMDQLSKSNNNVAPQLCIVFHTTTEMQNMASLHVEIQKQRQKIQTWCMQNLIRGWFLDKFNKKEKHSTWKILIHTILITFGTVVIGRWTQELFKMLKQHLLGQLWFWCKILFEEII